MEALHTLSPEAKAELYARKDFVQEDEEKVRKAVALVEEGRIEPTTTPDTYEVVGMSGTIYVTTPKVCACKARRTPTSPYPCYHLLGVALYRWVTEAMAKEGRTLYVDGPAQKTVQDAQEAGENTRGEANGAPGGSAPLQTAPDETAQRHDIRRLLIEYGLKPKTREDYADATEVHTGLPLLPENFGAIIQRLHDLVDARRRALPSPKLLSDYMVDIKGKKHIQYGGLLAYAHEQGLVSLTANLTTVSKELAIATATATFKDGRSFTETADATPENVGPQIKPHFMRMAVTRAKARALRDALNIGEAAAEELE